MHCLNLKLTYQCSNQCSFCFASHLASEKLSVDGLKMAISNGYETGCRELVFSGGEPTVVPDILNDLLLYSNAMGYKKFILQTNGYGLANNQYLLDTLDSIAKEKDVCVSFSVHGHTADIHDKMCNTSGAFEKIMLSIKKISETNCKIYTNTVISSLNYKSLDQIASLIIPFNPEIIQFSMMHLSKPNYLSVGLNESVKAVKKLKHYIDLNILRTEGIPYCLLYGMEQCVGESYWPTILDLYNNDNYYLSNFNQLNSGMRWKHRSCNKCLMNSICMGIWKEHADEFIQLQIHPIQ